MKKQLQKNAPKRNRSIAEAFKYEFQNYLTRPALKRRVLVINKNYQPITTFTLKKAINKIFNENAIIVLPPNSKDDIWQELTWTDWAELEPQEGEIGIKTISRVFKIPEIIKLTDYYDVPYKTVKLTRKSIYQRDNYTCQYCGKSAPNDLGVEELSIDHVLAKSRFGKTEWTNLVLACVECNKKKGDKTPQEAKMPLLKTPTIPEYDVLHGHIIRVDSWKHFLGDAYWGVPLKD